MKRRFKLFTHKRIINGTKGAIALFLAVLMTPFLTIAMILVEAGRYNSAVSILDESLGVSSTALLANYDEYIRKRWGLLSVDQKIDIDTTYSQYITKNSSVLGSSLSLNSVKANGQYSLSDSEVLYNQILEFCKLNAPTKLATNFLNITDLINKLEKLSSIGSFFDLIGNGADAIDSTITLADSAEDLRESADKLDTLVSDYNNDYYSLSSAVSALKSKLGETRPEDENAAREYDRELARLRSDVNSKRSTYSSTIQELINELSTYKEKMKACDDALINIRNDIASSASAAVNIANNSAVKEKKELEKEIGEMEKNGQNSSMPAIYTQKIERLSELENEVAEISAEAGLASATVSGLKSIDDDWKNSFNNYSDATMGEMINGLRSLKSSVDRIDANGISASFSFDETNYHSISVNGYISAADIDAYLEDQRNDMESGGLKSLIDGITSFINSVFKLNLIYDPSLSAYIDVGYYSDNIGGLPGADSSKGGALAIVSDIGNIISSITTFGSDLVTLKWLDALKQLRELLDSIISLSKDIVQFAIDICNNIINLFTSYDRLYYTTYTTFNLPCRTDCLGGSPSFTALTGYKLNSASLPSQNTNSVSITLIDDLVALVNQIRDSINGSGDDITFSGAELEYVLFGSNSELANQEYTFVSLYLLRLLLDIAPILSNAEVQSLAAASTLGYPVVMLLEILAEPLADTVVLVNGGKVDFFKTKIYLTPSGMVDLLGELSSVARGMTSEQKNELSNGVLSAFNTVDDSYNYKKTMGYFDTQSSNYFTDLFKFDYREYCFILLLLTVTKEQQVARLSNLIQTETTYYYGTVKKEDFVFNINNAFTYLYVDADVSVKQMLPSLADSSLFSIERKQYRGY